MKDSEVLELFKPLVKYLAEIEGPSSEVVLHDVSHPASSVIAIENGFHSGRKVGSPLTDLSLKIIKDKDYLENDYISNYSGKLKNRESLSSTFYIKNRGRLIGLLCVNRDTTAINSLENALTLLKSQYNLTDPSSSSVTEVLDAPVPELLEGMVRSAIADAGMDPEHMKSADKMEIVRRLQEHRIMDMKGAVAEIAKHLHISQATVYRYVKKL